jgi:hypothetical protein
MKWSEDKSKLRAILFAMTHGPENANDCKPSRMTVEFCGVSQWAYLGTARGDEVELDTAFSSPPVGSIAVEIPGAFHVICRSIHVVNCSPDPFMES